MKLRVICAALAVTVAVAAAVVADTVSIPGTGVSFEPPAGFTVLSAKEIQAKYPSSRAPSFVVGNERRSTTIGCDLKGDELSFDQLPEAKAAFEPLLERMVPGIEWVRKELVTLQGQQWIYLEMTSRAVDTDIHNIMLITSLRDRLFLCNFNSTKREFPSVQGALQKSIESLKLPSAAPGT